MDQAQSVRFAEAYMAGPDGSYVHRHRGLGGQGVQIVEVEQPAGVYETPGTRDIVLGIVAAPGVTATMDFGAGAFDFHSASGPLFMSPAWTPSVVTVNQRHTATLLSIPRTQVADVLGELPGGGIDDLEQLYAGGFENPHVAHAVRHLLELPDADSPATSLLRDAIVRAIVLELYRATAGHPQSYARGGLTPLQLRRAKELLAETIDRQVHLAELAEHLGLSAFHFWRAFHQSAGCSPFRWQLLERVRTACVLLKETDLTMLEIAVRVGYGSSQAFGRVFRRETGVTPMRYRQTVR